MALVGDLRGPGGTKAATSLGWNGSRTSKARTPPLKNVPTTTSSEIQPPGRFSCRLWAPKRPPRPANFFTGGSGHVLIGTSLSSRCASTIHTSLGQSLAASRTDSSLTTSKFLSNKGTTVWQKPGKGG